MIFCAVMMLLCSFAYPLALTGASQLAMKEKANGNLIDKEGNPTTDSKEAVGSALVGQEFTEDYYFQGRPSAVGYNNYTEEELKMVNTVAFLLAAIIMGTPIRSWKRESKKIWMSF